MEKDRNNNLRRRPLPTPNTSPSPDLVPLSQPEGVMSPVSRNNFHGNQQPAPPLPRRSLTAGSALTGYHYIPPYQPEDAETSSPPSYTATTLGEATWRQPELVQEVRDDDMPDLVSTGRWGAPSRGRSPTYHAISSAWAGGGSDDWTVGAGQASQVCINGRDAFEELDWWDRELRLHAARPGPGILPTLLAEKLHDADHSLFAVSVTPPDTVQPLVVSHSSSGFQPPTHDQLHEAVPHPNAFYCRKENGWALLVRRSSSRLPLLAPSFEEAHPGVLFPNQDRRLTIDSCIDDNDEQPLDQINVTHHFHMYPCAVSSLSLNPPFLRVDWERHQHTDQMEDIEVTTTSTPSENEGVLLDLYVCCQCSVYVLCSETIPGVIPAKYLDELVRERAESPLPGQSSHDAAILALDTTLKIMENILWRNETRALPIGPGKSFVNKVGLSAAALHIYHLLGFSVPAQSAELTEPMLFSPVAPNRPRLLRAWVELGAWLQDYRTRFPPSNRTIPLPKRLINVENARESYQLAIGAHPNQITRQSLPGHPHEFSYPLEAVEKFGFTPTAYSPNLLEFAYRAQCRCDPEKTSEYYELLSSLVMVIRAASVSLPLELDTLLASEYDRGRWVHANLEEASNTLGFGRANALKVDLEESEDEFVLRAWKDAMARAWKDPDGGTKRRGELTRALHIIAESRSSRRLKEEAKDSKADLTPEKAYQTLEVPSDVGEEMLITIYKLRIDDQPSHTQRMKDALTVITQWTDSARLRTFLETGEDPGDSLQVFHPEWPRGLNQLGNTCYLNSLLQYFYTIKDLREALVPPSISDDTKLSDDDLKRHRVGGRLVTRKEILRSRKFVAALGNLFWELEYSETPAITPDLELAKLALVTSKDEEEDERGRNEVGTDSSASTDATLVDEPAPIGPLVSAPQPASTSPPTPSALSPSPSVLGKRQRRARSASTMDVDRVGDPDRDGFILVSKPKSLTGPQGGLRRMLSGSLDSKADVGDLEMISKDQDVDMRDATVIDKESKPPPLPPRRKPDVNSESVMMFGKQHDVAECMDNCMFQIETALLRFDDLAGSEKSKVSVVKRLFYGTIRQRISPLQPETGGRGSSIHEKEDMFSHLPVNVSEESFDIYDGLSGYFDDTVELEGKKAKMEVSLVDLPPILQIQLQRVQFNRDTLQPYKSHAYVRFDETLYVDRFLDGADPTKRAKSKTVQLELSACRDRIHALTQGNGTPYVDGLARTLDFLSNQDAALLSGVDDELLLHLSSERQAFQEEITELRSRAARLKEELETIWRDEKRAEYELTSVFVHRGSSASWGHYFFYSRCLPDRPDLWFKYNDSEVTQVRKDEVLADTTGSTANPYLLVYARKGSDTVHTVKRVDPSMLS